MADPLKGRGALTNRLERFQATETTAVHDGWPGDGDDELPSLVTSVAPEQARSVITYNESPDISFDRSINPYRGCEHGCIYCYARPSHAYLGLSPGLDFETRLTYKADAAALLRTELARPSYRCAPIMLGANTDPVSAGRAAAPGDALDPRGAARGANIRCRSSRNPRS